MKIICIGDSLTEGDYGKKGMSGVANVHAENYPYFLQKLTGCEVVNLGFCGITSMGYIERIRKGELDLHGGDIYIIMLGTNGGMSGTEDTQGNHDYDAIVDYCKEISPNAKIFVCAPPRATENPAKSNCGYMPRIMDAVTYVRNYACEHSDVTLIDVMACKSFTAETEDVMQPNDGLHFGEEGYKALANFIYENIKEVL